MTPRSLPRFRFSSTLRLLVLALAPAACQHARAVDPPKPPQGPDPRQLLAGPLVALPPEIKATDFRVSPPVVESVTARRAPDGRAILGVRFAADARVRGKGTLALFPDGKVWDLRDDGREGDDKAGDGVFSTVTAMPFDQLLDEQKRMRADLANRKITTIQRFHGLEQGPATPIPGLRPDGWPPFEVLHSLGIGIDPARSLTVTAIPVVEDPTRTAHPCTGAGAGNGKWSFGYLMSQMAGPGDPTLFTESFFNLLNTGGTAPNGELVNGLGVHPKILDPWPKRPDGHIDLARAPLKLIAIVNRIDLAGNVAYGAVSGAEGRFIFEVFDRTASPGCRWLGSTGSDPIGAMYIILEYGVPLGGCTDLRDWAAAWAALSTLPLGSPEYNAALEALTERFAAAGAGASKPNGSAINQIRVNEIPLLGAWHLQQIHLTSSGLRAANTSQTPSDSFSGGTRAASLAAWVNANAGAILNHTHTVPAFLGANPFLAGVSFNDPPVFWRVTGAADNDARHAFSLDTCNGCHGRETQTQFVHVGGAPGVGVGGEAPLSDFLTGITVVDPVDSTRSRHFGDLARRASVLDNLSSSSCLVDVRPPPLVDRRFHFPIPPVDVRPTLSAH